jgi:hypothetical protein
MAPKAPILLGHLGPRSGSLLRGRKRIKIGSSVRSQLQALSPSQTGRPTVAEKSEIPLPQTPSLIRVALEATTSALAGLISKIMTRLCIALKESSQIP